GGARAECIPVGVGRTWRADRALHVPGSASLYAGGGAGRADLVDSRQTARASERQYFRGRQRVVAGASASGGQRIATFYRGRGRLFCLRRGAATGKYREGDQGRSQCGRLLPD